MVEGPAAGLAHVEGIDGLDRYHLLHSTRAELLRRLDRNDEAAAAYERALELAPSGIEQAFLRARISGL
jgi:predicted RNA polymerase sigma factor